MEKKGGRMSVSGWSACKKKMLVLILLFFFTVTDVNIQLREVYKRWMGGCFVYPEA